MAALLIVWLVMAGIVGLVAHGRGRAPAPWFLYGLFLWPVALVHVLVTPADRRVLDARAIGSGTARKCPHCAELVRPEARICKHCGRDLPAPALAAAAPRPPAIDAAGRALTPCPNCLTGVPADAARCPECSYPLGAS